MFKYLILLFLSLAAPFANSTTFSPVSIKNQLKTSSMIVEGQVISITSELLDGEIVTKVSILPDRWMNLKLTDSLAELYYPGGKMETKALKVEGAPEFVIGEKVVVFANKFKNKNWISNLGLGKFSIKIVGETQVMVNQIFPGRPQVGQMRLDKFHELSKWVKKQNFEFRYKDKYEINAEKEAKLRLKARVKGRSIASIKEEREQVVNHKFPAYWLVLILGLLGVFFGMTKNKE